jgi:hypothetical protein
VNPNDSNLKKYKLNSSAKVLFQSSALLFFLWMAQYSTAEILAEAHWKNSTFAALDAIIGV